MPTRMFDILDPFDIPDPLRPVREALGPFAPRPASDRPEYRRPLPAAEHASMGKQMMDAGTSGLSWVLDTLDKPGQAARGVLAGKGLAPLKHLVPFAGSMGLIDEKDKTSGRDLTDTYGVTDKADTGWGAWGKGLAADLVTDPTNYLSFGTKAGLNAAGKAATKAGALKGWSRPALLQGFHGSETALYKAGKSADDIAHMTRQGKRIIPTSLDSAGIEAGKPLAGLVRASIPFGPGVSLGTGEFAQKIASRMDRAGNFLKYGNPIGRSITANFDHTAGGAVDAITQKGFARHGTEALDSGKRTAREDLFDVLKGLDPVIKEGVFDERTVVDAARAMAENAPHAIDPALRARLGPVVKDIYKANARYLDEARAAGLPLQDLQDPFTEYVRRQSIDVDHRSLQMGGKRPDDTLFPTKSGADISRDPLFTEIPGGTARINSWFDRFAGLSSKSDLAYTQSVVRRELANDLAAGGRQMTPKLGKLFDQKAEMLAERIAASSGRYRSTAATATDDAVKGLPFFSPDLAGDMAQRGQQHARTMAAAKAAYGIIGDNARAFAHDGSMVSVRDLLKQLGLVTSHADKNTKTAASGAMIEAVKAMARQGAVPAESLLHAPAKRLSREVGRFGVTNEQANQITKAYAGWASPEPLKAPLKALDSATNAFKSLAYPIWIPSHVRNAFTALTNNAQRGVGVGDYLAQLKLMTGRGGADLGRIHPSLAGLSDPQQIEALRKMQYGAANIGGGNGMSGELAGAREVLESGAGRFTPEVPLSDRVGRYGNVALDSADLVARGLAGSVGATAKTAGNFLRNPFDVFRPSTWGQHFAPLGIKGVGDVTKDALPAVAAGRKAGTNIEDFFRGSLMNRELRRGLTPDMAAREVNRLHFDYDALAGFEKNWMRRLVPFYTFARRNLPLQARTAITTPGMITAQYKPFKQPTPGEEDAYIPEYLRSGTAIPTGPEVNGHRQYVSKLGLPAEDAFSQIHMKNGLPDVGRTAMDFMSMLNPLAKAPLEQLFNTQLHTQRKLSDLRPQGTVGWLGRRFGDDNPQLLSQILANTPLTRFVSSADKLMDDRKSIGARLLNLGTGVRVSDVDVEKSRAIETRAAIEKLLDDHKRVSSYPSFYVKPKDAASLTPEEVTLMRYYTTVQDQQRAWAKAHKNDRIGVKP